MLKNTALIVLSRHISVSNFIMNLISALGAYCFHAAFILYKTLGYPELG